MELNAEAVLDCFARSYGLGANGEIDAGAWNKFAEDWVQYLMGKTPPSQAERLEDQAPPAQGPPGGTRPPGFPPGGGGGAGSPP